MKKAIAENKNETNPTTSRGRWPKWLRGARKGETQIVAVHPKRVAAFMRMMGAYAFREMRTISQRLIIGYYYLEQKPIALVEVTVL